MLTPQEKLLYSTRQRWISLQMLAVFGSIVVAVAICAFLLKDPGFLGLASLPAFPLIGSGLGHLMFSPAIFVTDQRIVYARRFEKPVSIDFVNLRGLRIRQTRAQQFFGFGELSVLIDPPGGPQPDRFLSFSFPRLPDAVALQQAVVTAMEGPHA